MGILERKTAWEKEWANLERQEARFLKKHAQKKESFLNQKLEGRVPDKLQDTLDGAFVKAFEVVFQKGDRRHRSNISERKKRKNYQVREYAADLQEDRRTLRAFSKKGTGNRDRKPVDVGNFRCGAGSFGDRYSGYCSLYRDDDEKRL